MEGNKVMFALLLLTALCAVVAIIISAVTLSRPSAVPTITLNGIGGGQTPVVVTGGGSSGGGFPGRKSYLVHVTDKYAGFVYFDEKNYHQGFNRDLISEVCELAGIECRMVVGDNANCWETRVGDHPVGGKGLQSRWYDACAGYYATHERIQVFDFSEPYSKPSEIHLFYKKGSGFNWRDLRGKKIGFVTGAAPDNKCIARQSDMQGNILPPENIKNYGLRLDAVKALQNGQVDAVLSDAPAMRQIMGENNISDVTADDSKVINCAIHGHSIMTRKDSDFIPHWNRGFQKMKMSGRYDRFCEEAKQKHGHMGSFNCLN